MPQLPIRRMILYKHGVGYFERRGAASGTALRLSFPRAACKPGATDSPKPPAGSAESVEYESRTQPGSEDCAASMS